MPTDNIRPNELTNSIIALPPRIPVVDQGVAQQPEDKIKWLRDSKFGMFIHWGLYAGPGLTEWYMHEKAMSPEAYRKLAFPESGDNYFAADHYNPSHWAEVAKAAGMKWMCLTSRHHDGYCLFDSPHPNAFTSMQTHHRDFVLEYTNACRASGLKVGLYYSPLSWRYPGYYDVTGTDCKPNVFGYSTDPAHKENARLMKEENYANVHKLMTGYGEIDHIYWDGGWLAQQGTDADGAYFNEPGQYLNPNNPWPISSKYLDYDSHHRPLGITGMVRKHQPNVIQNLRYGWVGDILEEEGGPPSIGPIRSTALWDKCISGPGGWGYNREAIDHGNALSRDRIIEYLVHCVVRDMVFLLNFGPDRHGQMPSLIESHLRKVGEWLSIVGESIYQTRGGPWQPVDSEYGYCWKENTVYLHLLSGYQGSSFTIPPVGPLSVSRIVDLFTKKPLTFNITPDRTVQISNIDRTANPVDTVVAIQFDKEIMTYANRPDMQ